MRRAIPAELVLLIENIKRHKVIVANPYTQWFAKGEATLHDVTALLVQFSVFSNEFLAIQARRMVNATGLGLGAEGEAREILVSELGVNRYKVFRHEWAHINWLRETAGPLGLAPPNIPYPLGHWDLGSEATHEFLDELLATYGSRDASIGAGASFAIETWAGFGLKKREMEHLNFWKQLIVGLRGFNAYRVSIQKVPLKLDFFEFHVGDEKKHVESVERELMETFTLPQFEIRKWEEGAFRALTAIETFWNGLDNQRKEP